MLIGVVVCGIVEEYSINLIQSIEHMSEKNDVKCVIIPIKFLGLDYEKELNNKYGYCYNAIASYGLLSCFDGLIIETASVLMYADDETRKKYIAMYQNIPHVFIAFNEDDSSSVSIDNQAGLEEALEYMYQNGARKYAMFGGTPNNIDSIVRKECFEQFVKNHNLPYSSKSYQDGNFFLPCEDEAEQLVCDNMDADVFVCANDFLARHIYRALRKNGKRPGQDVSVIGFDDSQICTATYPAISSIRTDIVEVGKVSYQLLMDAIDKKPAKKVVVPSKFILRDSIYHRVYEKEERHENYQFKDFLMPNVMYENNQYIEKIRTVISEITKMLDNQKSVSLDNLLNDIYLKLDELFSCDGLDLIDWERFANATNEKYRQWIMSLSNPSDQQKITDFFIKFHEMVMTVNHYVSPEKNYVDFIQNIGMERFFRETMQFVRNAEANYTRFIKSVGFLGIQNAYLYIYDEPQYYMQGEQFEVPEFVNLKAVLKDGEVMAISHNQQRMKSQFVFDNAYVDWKGYSRLMLFPVYSDNIIYGILVCDIKRKGFEQADLFINQLGAGIRMMNLRIENRRIVDNYEESVRKLREYNITLDNMSKTDSLTGLNNRRGFYMRTHKLLELFPNDSLSVVIGYADMNDLKVVNDRFGHDDGDFALKSIGELLTDYVTMHNGFGARIGGDEFAFVIIVPKGSELETYRKELYDLFDVFNQKCIKPYRIDISIGDYLYEKGDMLTLDDALHQADERLYYEKNIRKQKSILKEL
ncbi:MAG: GGDEF domain-containing protein [Eubacteriales bacterium]|nr:GGDEF domain-containing protein [Eubacteriales bacterium]